MKHLASWREWWLGNLLLAFFCSVAMATVVEVEQKAEGADTGAMPDVTELEPLDNAPTPAPIKERINRRQVVTIGNDVHIGPDEYSEDIVVIGGRAHIEGEVRGNVVVISGQAQIDGKVRGSVVSVLGGAVLGPNARVHENVVTIGGGIEAASRSKTGGERVSIPFGLPFNRHFFNPNRWFGQGLVFGPPPAQRWGGFLGMTLLIFLFYVLLAVLFPGPLRRCTEVLESHPLKTMFAGMLGFLLIGPVILLLIITIVGILTLPFVVFGLLVAFVFGKVALYRYAGDQMGRHLKLSVLQHPIGALAGGMVAFTLIDLIPFFGSLVWCLASVFAFGAVLLALFGAKHREKPALASILPATPKSPGSPGATGGMPPVVPPSTPVMNPTSPSASVPPLVSTMVPPVSALPGEPAGRTPFSSGSPITPFAASAQPAKMGLGAGLPPADPTIGGLPPLAQPEPPLTSPGAPRLGGPLPGALPPADLSALPLASFRRRIWAAGIDLLFVSAGVFFLLPEYLRDGPGMLVIWSVVYFAAMWVWRGTTLGGIIMQLQVVRLDGQPLKPEVAIIRALAAVLSCLPLLLGFLWAAWDRQHQTWHDKIAGTMVVAIPVPRSLI
jgi:uncharacterized RDD family membrane protein YckC